MRNVSASLPLLATAVGLLAALATGCPKEVPIERRLCERFDDCNFFGAGIDVDDCADIMTMCTEDLVTSQKNDWTRQADAALGNENCINFLEAYQEVDVCLIDDEGEIVDPPEGTTVPANEDCSGGDRFDCTEEHALGGCFEGEAFAVSCWDICGEDGQDSAGCGFSSDKGHDVCFCEDGGASTTDSGPGSGDSSTGSPTTVSETSATTTGDSVGDSSTGGSDPSAETTATETGVGDTSGPVPP